jgi:hypothetical protein
MSKKTRTCKVIPRQIVEAGIRPAPFPTLKDGRPIASGQRSVAAHTELLQADARMPHAILANSSK